MSCICPSHFYKDKDGYPTIKYNRRMYRGNRLMYELCFGEIPKHLVVAHKCNNSGCINPNHLYLTTAKDNSTDAARDGLYRKGDSHPKTKWKVEQIMKMKDMYDDGSTQQSIADLFGVTQGRVSECIKRARKIISEHVGDNR